MVVCCSVLFYTLTLFLLTKYYGGVKFSNLEIFVKAKFTCF